MPKSPEDLILAAAAALPVNVWTHMALTYDGTTLRLYVGGAQIATRAVTGSWASAISRA